MQFYYGNSLNSADLVRYSGYVEGRLCNAQDGRFLYSLFSQTVTVFFHTDGSGSGSRGLQISFTALGKARILHLIYLSLGALCCVIAGDCNI